MNLPNKLTVTRVVLAVLFVMALLLPENGLIRSFLPFSKSLALLIFVVASLTDWWDGWYARRHNLETPFGMLMDPLADKILTAAAFICFIEQRTIHDDPTSPPLVQAWMALVIIARDFLVTGLRLVASRQGLVLRAERLGKHKTASQLVTIIVVLLGLAAREDWHCFGADCNRFESGFAIVVFWMMVVTVLLTLWSGIAYLSNNRAAFLRDA